VDFHEHVPCTEAGLCALEMEARSYPRTKCVYLSAEHADEMPALLKRLAGLPEVAAVAQEHPEWIERPVIRPASYDDARPGI
jgi:hypothetical protein